MLLSWHCIQSIIYLKCYSFKGLLKFLFTRLCKFIWHFNWNFKILNTKNEPTVFSKKYCMLLCSHITITEFLKYLRFLFAANKHTWNYIFIKRAIALKLMFILLSYRNKKNNLKSRFVILCLILNTLAHQYNLITRVLYCVYWMRHCFFSE